jgi:hypothetical protein
MNYKRRKLLCSKCLNNPIDKDHSKNLCSNCFFEKEDKINKQIAERRFN